MLGVMYFMNYLEYSNSPKHSFKKSTLKICIFKNPRVIKKPVITRRENFIGAKLKYTNTIKIFNDIIKNITNNN